MGGPTSSALMIRIRLVRPGVDVRDYHLPDGATLADLLRAAGAPALDQTVFVDGLATEEALPLRDGAIVTVAPKSRNAAGDEPWHATIPAFRDEDLFREYSEILEARRHADRAASITVARARAEEMSRRLSGRPHSDSAELLREDRSP